MRDPGNEVEHRAGALSTELRELMESKVILDQYQYLGNCEPTHLQVRSCPDTDIDPNDLALHEFS